MFIKQSIYKPCPLAVFLAPFLFVKSSLGNELADELRYRIRAIPYWAAQESNLINIEDYSYRHIHWNSDQVDALHQALRRRFVPSYNLIQYQTIQDPTQMVNDFTRHTAEQLDDFLEALPIIEHTAYHGREISPAYFDQIQVGEGMLETGFMHGTGSLHHVYEHMPEETPGLTRLIVKIESKTGCLINILYDNDHSLTLWPKHSYFQVIAKDEDRLRNIKFLHLKQITTEHASSLARIRALQDGRPINLAGKRIVLSCL